MFFWVFFRGLSQLHQRLSGSFWSGSFQLLPDWPLASLPDSERLLAIGWCVGLVEQALPSSSSGRSVIGVIGADCRMRTW